MLSLSFKGSGSDTAATKSYQTMLEKEGNKAQKKTDFNLITL